MPNKKDKRKGITINHQDCIKHLDLLHKKMGEKEGDYNNLLLQNKTLQGIVENQANEILELKNQIKELTSERNELLQNQKKMENILDELEINDNFGGLFEFLKLLYKNKNDFMDFINIKKNNKKIVDPIQIDVKLTSEYISLKNKNSDMQKQLDEENMQRKELDKIHKEEITNIKSQYENSKQSIPTPSSSAEIKNKIKIKEQSKKEEEIILDLPKNLFEVIYNRNIKNNYSYFKKDHKKYLRCCNTDYDHKEISNTNFITCSKCFRTFNLSKEVDENNIYNIFVKILKNHIIKNEEELYKQIKCNTLDCNYISKKEINFCYKCKNMEICIPIITKLPDNNKEGIETVKTFASETYNNLLFYKKVFESAKKEKINIYEMKPLVDFIKNNKLMKEKQPNIIIKKILRSIYILDLYNEDKYIEIHDIIKRIYINLDTLAKLDDTQFIFFQNILINILDKEIEKKGDTNIKDNTLEYSCKNEICDEKVNMENTYCLDCIPDVKKCKNKKCNQDFWQDDEDIEFCENCKDPDIFN